MPIRGFAQCQELAPLLRGAADWLGPDVDWFDAHTHEGSNDPDGLRASAEEVLAGLDQAGHRRALIFAMHEPGGDYREANEVVRASCARSGGRLRMLARVDPSHPRAVDELRRCLESDMCCGLKLHPRSDGFALPHPVVDVLAGMVAERGGIVLFHAGRGIPLLGEAAAALAQRHLTLKVVLAHAGISDLGLLAEVTATTPNLYFDTAWWQLADLLALMTSVPPGQVLYASDMPYGPGAIAGFLFARAARQAGWTAEQARVAAGAQLGRIVDGREPLDLGPAVGERAMGERSPALERVSVHTAVAVNGAWRGVDPAEAVALARLGCQVVGREPHAELLRACDALLAYSAEALASRNGTDPRELIDAVLAAHGAAGTPSAGVPGPLPV